MSPRKKKIFVLDTNVILHDSTCIHQFQEHDIIVPISVIEELDHFKKGNESVHYHAREFVRSLDELTGDRIFNGGISLGASRGKFTIKLETEIHPDLALALTKTKPDHQIINTAYHCAKENPSKQVVLVTKDVNLRIRAKAVGLMAEDYTTDHIENPSALYTGHRLVENVPAQAIDRIHNEPFVLDNLGFMNGTPLFPNEFLILRDGQRSALGVYHASSGTLRRVDKGSAYGISPRNAEQTFALSALLNDDVQLVTLSGKAGTGKTLLALAAALQARKQFRQIFMARPVVPLSNKDLGFLPGDIQSKLDPYMQPLFDNLGVLRLYETSNQKTGIGRLLEEDKLVISPLAYIRGRSLVKIFFIVDEAQNLTPHEIKTIITRAGEGTKIVFTGDIYQIDHPYLDVRSNGLSHLIEKMKGQRIYAHVNLQKGERSELADLASDIL